MDMRQFRKHLEERGLRLTSQRLAIAEYVMKTRSHPSVLDIYEHVRKTYPTLSLATVYKTLDLLQEMGVLYKMSATKNGSSRYETSTEPHINLMCKHCNRIIDLNLPKEMVERLFKYVDPESFEVHFVGIEFFGVCNECKARMQRSESIDVFKVNG